MSTSYPLVIHTDDNYVNYYISGPSSNTAYVGDSPDASGNLFILPEVSYNNTTYPVTYIADDAFSSPYTYVTGVIIPDTITSIGSSAFQNCSYLFTVSIPNSVTSIGTNAFDGIGQTGNIPNGIDPSMNFAYFPTLYTTPLDTSSNYVYNYFYNPTQNNSTFPSIDSTTSNNSALTLLGTNYDNGIIYVDGLIVEIDDGNVVYCSSETGIAFVSYSQPLSMAASIPSSVTDIQNNSYSVTTILSYACYNSSFYELVIPNTVTSIGSSAFQNCGLFAISIPNSVTNIGTDAFAGNLTNTTTNPTNPTNAATLYNSSVPSGYVYNYFFTTANFGSTINYVTGLIVYIDQSNIIYASSEPDIAYVVYTLPQSNDINIPSSVTDTSSVATYSVTSISNYAFYNNNKSIPIVSVVIPNNVSLIGTNAFQNCNSLTSITFPTSSLNTIGESAFYNTNLALVTIPNSVTSIGSGVFQSCTVLTSITFPNNNSFTTINNGVCSGCFNLTSITFPTSLITINDSAFVNCSSLTSITIPANVTSIGSQAFAACTNLMSIYVDGNVTNVYTTTTNNVTTTNIFGDPNASPPNSILTNQNPTTLNAATLHTINSTNALYTSVFDTFENTINYDTIYDPGAIRPDPDAPCFKENTKILTDKGYIPIQNLNKGDLVKTINDGFKPIVMIGKQELHQNNIAGRIRDNLFKLSSNKFPELSEDLIITGGHSILLPKINEEEKNKMLSKINESALVIDNHFRLLTYLNNQATLYEEEGIHTIYHIALEGDYNKSYGIFANGLLVESCDQFYLKECSNMTII